MSMDASYELMASRGRRGGVPTRDGEQRRDEPRREEQTEQQAPTPQGPILPPPPPVDYGVFMQGLVQAMQTQAHTQAALQAQIEAQITPSTVKGPVSTSSRGLAYSAAFTSFLFFRSWSWGAASSSSSTSCMAAPFRDADYFQRLIFRGHFSTSSPLVGLHALDELGERPRPDTSNMM
ncbi:hypothetical protein Taro_008686 [Colocasia esculenta]|uniref:Uncharacterized protein n=1 Tax=Colocasia esculenta TaxID=4460 RepID=A0A843U2Z3_COLES|nr:hypothetical protein [Colocasia esculenta]